MTKEYHITRTPDGIRAHAKPGKDMPRETFLTFQYALGAYGHLIAMNEVLSGPEYIARVKKGYDATRPRHAACLRALSEGFDVYDK